MSAAIDVEQFRDVSTALARIFLIQIFFYGISISFNYILYKVEI